MDSGTLADDLGCFPFDEGPYHPPSDSHAYVNGIRSLIGVSTRGRARVHSVLYHRYDSRKASPKAISGRTSYYEV